MGTSLLDDQNEEIQRLRDEQHSQELSKLDSKATEIESSRERSITQQLRNQNEELSQQLSTAQYRVDEMEQLLEQFANEKIALISKTSEEINKLRGFVCHYQKYYEQQQQMKQQQQSSSSSSILTNLFG